MNKSYLAGAFCAALLSWAPAAQAVEGGLGAYFLGSRDSLAGIVHGAGTYVSLDFIGFSGSLENASIGGFPVFSADVDTTVYTLSITHVFDTTLWGGTPAINVNIPYADAELIYKGPLANGTKDTEAGFGDIVVTPLVGRHSGFQHWSAGISIFAPTGVYDEATVDFPNREIDALSIGKNV